ncbi:MAG TPA: hypothetical protein VKB28_04010 [Solirubrobacteraceae bacterium]|nr:hypothetical protein [Solirubrobacteraceae bacterium]
MRDQQPRGLLAAHPQQRVAQLGVRRAQVTALEQQPLHVGPPLRVAERVRVPHRCTTLEQDLEALGALRLDRVVDRLAVVRVRAAVEQ